MDFKRNPLPVPGDVEFSLDRLDDDVRAYLANSGALLAEPVDRLRKMNPLSVELYKQYKYHITRDPARICDQQPTHEWGARGRRLERNQPRWLLRCRRRSAGTHGVTRPEQRRAQRRPGVYGTALRRRISPREEGRTRSSALSRLLLMRPSQKRLARFKRTARAGELSPSERTYRTG